MHWAVAFETTGGPSAGFGEGDYRVRREHALLFSIINAATDPILFTNMEGQLIIANARARNAVHRAGRCRWRGAGARCS